MVSSTPRTVTPRELMDIREQEWRRPLQSASLVAEVLEGIDREHREQTLTVLAGIARRQHDSYHRELTLKRWPAVHVVATTGVAVDHYSKNTFWPHLKDLARVPMDQAFATDWGQAYLANLRRLQLPTFDQGDTDAGSRYLGRILLHSGIPNACLDDYFLLCHERRQRDLGIEPSQLIAWARIQAEAGRLTSVDKPVSRFLQYGEEFAQDVTSRVFELLDAVASGKEGGEVPLPERFRETARRLWAAGEVSPTVSMAGARTSVAISQDGPQLVIDPYGRGLLLRLPPVGEAPDGRAAWLVELDGVAQTVATLALLPGFDDVAPVTDVPILKPVRAASAALTTREDLRVQLNIIDERLPLLAFGEDGRHLPYPAPLPSGRCWLLWPGDGSTLQLRRGGVIETEAALPPGWAGWTLALVNLEEADGVELRQFALSRPVRSTASARIVVGQPVPGVHDRSGAPVFASMPEVRLPEDNTDTMWEVVVLNSDRDVLFRWSGRSSAELDEQWQTLPFHPVGTFSVRVRGPWGRGAQRTVTVVDQLRISYNPPWRRFAGQGLQPATASIQVGRATQIGRSTLDYPERSRSTSLRVTSGATSLTVAVTPPHMSVSYQSPSDVTTPAIRPIELFHEDLLATPGQLILELGSVGEPVLHLRCGSAVQQRIEPSLGRSGTYRFDLAKLTDTLSSTSVAALALDPDGHVLVARIRPRSLFRSIELDDDRLVFDGAAKLDHLSAVVYSLTAPWREPAVVPVLDGQAVLPAWLVGAGGLRVLVRIEDPWAPSPVPEWPQVRESVRLEQPGHVAGPTSGESALSSYLAGSDPFPVDNLEPAQLWTVRALVNSLGLGPRTREVAADVDAALERAPRESLESLSASRLPIEALPRLVVSAGLPWADLSDSHDDTPIRWNRRSALPAMLLSAADGAWSAEEVEEASRICGDTLDDLLAGQDPHATSGKLGPDTDLYDREPSVRPFLIAPLKLVPKALLDGDTRTKAAIDFVDHRHDERLEWLCKNSRRITSEIDQLVRGRAEAPFAAALTARRHPSADAGWRLIPTVSLGYAIAARLASRGHQRALEWIKRQQRPWADLAAVAPDMVTIDLIVAEALVASYDHSSREGRS